MKACSAIPSALKVSGGTGGPCDPFPGQPAWGETRRAARRVWGMARTSVVLLLGMGG